MPKDTSPNKTISDSTQYKNARSIIEGKMPVLITDAVLAETVWALTGKRYKIHFVKQCET
ncbi:hypothetical protein A9Q88_02090 [Gammaproteobacteria bacterium 50_400_T64]|nr:hypothetical protein A9Q88_02090 [Gammaproteobacteria bacterium 50_400_T64]